jgi:glucose-1-phosphate adenylyltransferase
MARMRVLAVVLAGGAGSRMDVLTRERAKPALPFAGSYRLIDFPLSNLHHSGVDDVWISVQYQSHSLDDEVANGRPWDLDRTRGGLRLLPPRQGVGEAEDGFAEGNADVLYQQRDQIKAFGADAVLIMSADHVYRLDFMDVVDAHVANGADCTVVTSVVSKAQASDHAVVSVSRDGRVSRLAYKPARPRSGTVATEIFVYRPEALFDQLEELHREVGEDGGGLGDFGEHLLPRMIESGAVYPYAMDGYWQDVGTPERYVSAHRDLLRGKVGQLDDPSWPILTRDVQRAPSHVHTGARVEDSLLSPGCSVRGTVRRSVVGPGVTIEAGAVVSDSIVLADSTIQAGARLSWAVVDTGVVIGGKAKVGGRVSGRPARDRDLVLVGRDSRIGRGARLTAGARLEPGSTA